MGRIIIITCQERNKRTGYMETIVSHGIDEDTGKNICLPSDPPANLGAKYDATYGAWIIDDTKGGK